MPLSSSKCEPCEGIGQVLNKKQAESFLAELKNWRLSADQKTISCNLTMKNFTAAVGLINKIAAIAESENHHPDIHLTGYRNLQIDLSTHALSGLTKNDFVVAAKIDSLDKELKK